MKHWNDELENRKKLRQLKSYKCLNCLNSSLIKINDLEYMCSECESQFRIDYSRNIKTIKNT